MFTRKGGKVFLGGLLVAEIERLSPGKFVGYSNIGGDNVDGHDADQCLADTQSQIAETVRRLYWDLPAVEQRKSFERTNEQGDALLYFDDKQDRARQERDYDNAKWAAIYDRIRAAETFTRAEVDAWLLEAGLTDELGFLVTTPEPPPPPDPRGPSEDDIPF